MGWVMHKLQQRKRFFCSLGSFTLKLLLLEIIMVRAKNFKREKLLFYVSVFLLYYYYISISLFTYFLPLLRIYFSIKYFGYF